MPQTTAGVIDLKNFLQSSIVRIIRILSHSLLLPLSNPCFATKSYADHNISSVLCYFVKSPHEKHTQVMKLNTLLVDFIIPLL